MSGHKRTTVTIDQNEYNRLQNVDAKLRDIQKSHIDQRTMQVYQQALQEDYQRLQNRQDQYYIYIESLDDQFRQVEDKIQKGISKQQEEIYSHIDSLSASLWMNIDELVNQHQHQYLAQLDELGRQQQIQGNRLNQTVQSLQDEEKAKMGLAETWIRTSESLLLFLDQHYEHQKFTPGRINDLYEQIMLAQENIYFGMPEAALTTAQQAYRSCSKLRIELEYLQNEWQMVYIATCEMVDRIYGIIEENWSVQALDIEGNEIDCVVDVNYWTNNLLLEMGHVLDGIREWLIAEDRNISLEQLQNLRKEHLTEIEKTVHDCRFQARIAALSSQIRINIADVALTALEQQGFSVQHSGYDRHDKRSSFTATTRHLDGSEVVIKVIPAIDDIIKNDLHVQSNDVERRTQHELRLRTEAIRRSLASYGLQLGPIQLETTKGYPIQPQPQQHQRVSESIQRANYR